MQLKKVIFMMRKLRRDLKFLKEMPIRSKDDTSAELGAYYIVFPEDLKKLNRLIHSFDENGVPLNAAYIDVENPELHYYPITIGQYGLAVFQSYLNSDSDEDLNRFLAIADWFMANATMENGGAYWITDVDKPEYNIKHPWKSAFSQSRAISILSRAWQKTGEQKYLDLAIAALNAFELSTAEGGVVARREPGLDFYEEYVAAVPTRVLDGHMFALFGIQDLVRISAKIPGVHDRAMSIFYHGITALTNWLPQYDMGYWVRYNQCEIPGYPKDDPCTIGYLNLVITQLHILHDVTGNDTLLAFAQRFESYKKPGNVLKMYRNKFVSLKKLNRL